MANPAQEEDSSVVNPPHENPQDITFVTNIVNFCYSEGPAPFSSEPITFSSTNESKSRIVIERREEVVPPNVSKQSSPIKTPVKEQLTKQR
ncbi:hypothetical protein J6590_056353 [Homalodisca vitripennis]|nr:hypothetical protein J6590_056353 [Homalodisca vitripennis]